MGAGLAGGPPCLPHSQVLMGAGLAGRPGTGLMGDPPPPSTTLYSDPCVCWASSKNRAAY